LINAIADSADTVIFSRDEAECSQKKKILFSTDSVLITEKVITLTQEMISSANFTTICDEIISPHMTFSISHFMA